MDYWLVLPVWKIINLQFLLTVDNDVSCCVTLGDFQKKPGVKKSSLTCQQSISSEKTKVTEFARLQRIMTCLQSSAINSQYFLVSGLVPSLGTAGHQQFSGLGDTIIIIIIIIICLLCYFTPEDHQKYHTRRQLFYQRLLNYFLPFKSTFQKLVISAFVFLSVSYI